MTALAGIIAARIAQEGPMRLDEYIGLCLMHPRHGYYSTRDPFGTGGDFITAPEISQMFGEIVGLALAQAWLDQGSPTPFTLAELGPGRGTLMADVLRAAGRVPGFAAGANVTLVERSPHLRAAQRERLGTVTHLDDADQLPDAPLLLIANEFFDALPIRQFQHVPGGWAERVVVCLDDGRLSAALSAPAALPRAGAPGEVQEFCPAAGPIMAQVAGRIARHGGAALVIDYGTWDGRGDSLQAVRAHAPEGIFDNPGQADLTAHVDFAPLAAAAVTAGAAASRPAPQGEWLLSLGIAERARRLAEAGDAGAFAALERLTAPGQMGQLFKVMAVYPRGVVPPSGIGPALPQPAVASVGRPGRQPDQRGMMDEP